MELIHFLQGSPMFALLCAGLLGVAIGSFLNVVILRLPVMMEREWRQQCVQLLSGDEGHALKDPASVQQTEPFNLVVPRSRCPHCGHQLRATDNIPILSYLVLKGRCTACGRSISPRYPIIEGATGLLSIAVIWHFGVSWEGLAALFLTWALVALSVIDFEHQLLPDSITLPFLWVGLTLSVFALFTDPRSAIIGASAGYLSLWSIYQLFKLATGKEGMGYGDFKLLAMLGAWMGWQYLLVIVLLSSFVGAIVGISLVALRGRDRNIPIPFGPYLATAGWLALLWGDVLIATYWRWIGPTVHP